MVINKPSWYLMSLMSSLQKVQSQDDNHRSQFSEAELNDSTDILALSRTEKVKAIESEALRLGWSKKSLYCTTGAFKNSYGPEYGLICFLGKEDLIGEVTRSYIEIMKSLTNVAPSRLKFYNPDYPQPWIKKIVRVEKCRKKCR